MEGLTFRGNERVLDLGCGDGILTRELARLVPQGMAVGIDASPGMIAAARELSANNLNFYLLDINDLDYQCAFDVIFSNAALHWVKDHRRLLSNVYMAVKPGGTVRFNFAADGNCSYFYRVVKEVMAFPEFQSSFLDFEWPWYMPGIEEYQTLLKDFHFNEIKVWEENADRYFRSAEKMIAWIDQPSIVPFLQYLPEADRTEFRDIVINKMIDSTRQSNGTCFETFRRINVYARK